MVKKRVYIISPFGVDFIATDLNTVSSAAKHLAELGLAPYCWHWGVYANTRAQPCSGQGDSGGFQIKSKCDVVGNKNSVCAAMEIGLSWLPFADAVYRLPNIADDHPEILAAQKLGKPIFTSITSLYVSFLPAVRFYCFEDKFMCEHCLENSNKGIALYLDQHPDKEPLYSCYKCVGAMLIDAAPFDSIKRRKI